MALSKTIEIHSLTKKMERDGLQVFSLCVGEPDYQPPSEVVEATAIALDLSERKNTPYTADQIVVSNGAKQAVLQALMAVVSPGDSVIIPAPYWTSYPDMVKICGGVPHIIPTLAEENYELSASALESALQSCANPTCVILCNPSNPSGCVSSLESFQKLAKVFEKYPQVTVNGFSKSHSMTGYRIERVEELQSKRDLTYSLLMSIPHLKCPKPSGAFYLLPDVSHYYGRTLTRQDGSKT
eukprot:gene31574-41001_t